MSQTATAFSLLMQGFFQLRQIRDGPGVQTCLKGINADGDPSWQTINGSEGIADDPGGGNDLATNDLSRLDRAAGGNRGPQTAHIEQNIASPNRPGLAVAGVEVLMGLHALTADQDASLDFQGPLGGDAGVLNRAIDFQIRRRLNGKPRVDVAPNQNREVGIDIANGEVDVPRHFDTVADLQGQAAREGEPLVNARTLRHRLIRVLGINNDPLPAARCQIRGLDLRGGDFLAAYRVTGSARMGRYQPQDRLAGVNFTKVVQLPQIDLALTVGGLGLMDHRFDPAIQARRGRIAPGNHQGTFNRPGPARRQNSGGLQARNDARFGEEQTQGFGYQCHPRWKLKRGGHTVLTDDDGGIHGADSAVARPPGQADCAPSPVCNTDPPPTEMPMAKLVAQSGPTAGREFPLVNDLTHLGRQSTQDVQIVDNMASRAHCQIRKDGRFYSLIDLGSRNGTLLNGRKIAERLLTYGDRIRVGEVEFLLVKEPGDVEIADLLTKYELKEKLGEGGMGIVYKAVQKSMAREVALKILAPRHSQKPKFVDQFIAEARAAGKLNHHHLIQVHDVSTENDINYFSMEFVDGPTAMEMLRRQGPFQVDEAVEIIRQVSRALAYAHDHRLIHQDIKPDNIMIGAGNVVKLADLGISKTFDEAEAESDNKKIMGTPAYMAPEAALGKRIDHRVDIYSLGATFYHLLTAKTPYPGGTPTDVLKAHVSLPVPRIRDLVPTLPESVEVLIQKLMAKNPDERPQQAGDVEKALDALVLPQSDRTGNSNETNILRRYAAGTPQASREDTPVELASDAPPAKSYSIAKISGILGLLAIGGVAAAVAFHREPEVVTPAPDNAATTEAAAVAPVVPPEPPKLDPGRAIIEPQLAEIEGTLSKPVDQIDLPATRARLQALPSTTLKDLAERRDAITRRLTDIEAQVTAARLIDEFAKVRAEAQALAQADNYDGALAKLAAFPGKDQKIVAPRVAEAVTEISRDKKAFVSGLEERCQSLLAHRDLVELHRLKSELPPSFANSELAGAIDKAVKTLEGERNATIATQVAAGAKDFREWSFSAVSDRAVAQRTLLKGTPAEAQFVSWIADGKRLDELAAALQRRLVALHQQRFRGMLAGFKDPDLMSADREQGLELRESNGGAVYLRWGKIPAKDLQAVADLLLKQEADAFKPAIVNLGQAAQAK